MNQYKVIYTPKAKEDLKAIYSYIAFTLKEREIAKKQVDRIRNSICDLDTSPERYTAVDWEPWSSMGMRKFPVNNYVVYYNVNKEGHVVTIIRIFYGGRDIEGIIWSEQP